MSRAFFFLSVTEKTPRANGEKRERKQARLGVRRRVKVTLSVVLSMHVAISKHLHFVVSILFILIVCRTKLENERRLQGTMCGCNPLRCDYD